MQKVAPIHPDEVVYEDNHLLVVNKRAGLVTQGAARGQPSLLELCRDYIREKYNKPGNVYLGIVSRLDSRTSGVIVIARTSKAAARLSKQFKERQPKKVYWALVEADDFGQSIADFGQLEDWLFKDHKARRMRCVPSQRIESGLIPENAKHAQLIWNAIGRSGNRTLLEIELKTGRKHQIRCQLANTGFPVVGDIKYGSGTKFNGRGIALHSKSVEFAHPTRKIVLHFDVKAPDCWKVHRYVL